MRFDDGYIMVESAAIVAFLTASHPEAGLQPQVGGSEHAAYLAWLSFLSANLYPAMSLGLHPEALADTEDEHRSLSAKGLGQVDKLFDLIDKRLEGEGPFLLGERHSAADYYLFMLACWARPSEASLRARCPHRRGERCGTPAPLAHGGARTHNVMQPKE